MRFSHASRAAEPPPERPYLMRVSLLNIRLTWSESPLRTWIGAPLASWLRADTAVAQMAMHVPQHDDHRTGVTVEWLDGERLVMQIPVQRFGPGSAFHPLSQWVREQLQELAGRRRPGELTPIEYTQFLEAQEPRARDRAARLLDEYNLG